MRLVIRELLQTAFDGYLLKIYTPTRAAAGNVRSYFSGHYQCYGMNVQAVCDSKCRFIFFGVASPGSTNDRQAIKEVKLVQRLKQIPSGLVIIGDAAYECNEKIVSMYYGISKQKEDCDTFNFYASE